MKPNITPEQLDALRRLGTCAVTNAIDTFEVRLRNEGFAHGGIRCLFPALVPMLGYAVTIKMRCSAPPMDRSAYIDRTDWWTNLLDIPAPRVVVLQDVDNRPGTGAFVGEVHSAILQALGCVGAVTNGAVRDLPAVQSMGFHLFASSVVVSHAYSHIVEIGGDVEVGGLKVKPGDLIHGDAHGVLSIPKKLAAKIPAVAAELLEEERKLIALCRSSEFTLEKLRAAVRANRNHKPAST